MTEVVTLDKVVPGGQSIAELASGKKVFVWGGLPGETVQIRITKKKRSWAEAVVEEVLANESQHRVEPQDEAYLSTSPWQIYDWEFENRQKHLLLENTFKQFGIDQKFKWEHDDKLYGYRNKMEFSFWWEQDTGLHLSFFQRGSKRRVQVTGSSLAMPQINTAARAVMQALREQEVDGRQLKSLIVRANQKGRVSCVLFVKDDAIGPLFNEGHKLPPVMQGMQVVYSDPRSPASVTTRNLQSYGESELHDTINKHTFRYSPVSFFQVNVPMFKRTLEDLHKIVRDSRHPLVDFYSGVGTIGLSIGADVLVESDSNSIKWAKENVKTLSKKKPEVFHASAEEALRHITPNNALVVDPPRAGLHKKITQRITEVKPPEIFYLSCNPATQARDVQALLEDYNIEFARGYNFFPRTPHIESLLYLKAKS